MTQPLLGIIMDMPVMKEEIFNDFWMIISKSSEKVISSQN